MKVLYLIPGLGAAGGSERSLLAVTPALRAAGIELTIAYFVVRPNDSAAAYEEAGATVVRLDAQRLPDRVRAVRRLLRRERPDVVHTTLYEADVAGRLAAIGLPARVIASYTNSNLDVARRQDPTYRWWRVELVRWFAGITARRLASGGHAVSDAARQAAARAYGTPVDEIAVVHRGRTLDDFRAVAPDAVAARREELGVPTDGQLILAVGRHEFQKDQATLVRALAEVRRAHPGAVLAIAGRDGAMTGRLRTLVEELGLGDAVRLLGPRSDVAELMAAADAIAFSSILEGFSGVMVEAVASGRPLVASAIPPNRELLRGTEVALVAPGDAPAFARALVDVLDHPEQAAARTAAALESVRAWVSVDHAARGMVELYRSLERPGSRVVAADAGARRRLILVDDLGAPAVDAEALLARVDAAVAAGEVPAVATFAVGDQALAGRLQDRDVVVHHLAGTTGIGRALARRRLVAALAPIAVDHLGGVR